jgi:hypothetical protein
MKQRGSVPGASGNAAAPKARETGRASPASGASAVAGHAAAQETRIAAAERPHERPTAKPRDGAPRPDAVATTVAPCGRCGGTIRLEVAAISCHACGARGDVPGATEKAQRLQAMVDYALRPRSVEGRPAAR